MSMLKYRAIVRSDIMTITFCGHSQFVIDYKIRGILEEVLIELIENGAKDFY